jgi:hypothetical protein
MGKKTEEKHSLDCEEVCTGSDLIPNIAFLVKELDLYSIHI